MRASYKFEVGWFFFDNLFFQRDISLLYFLITSREIFRCKYVSANFAYCMNGGGFSQRDNENSKGDRIYPMIATYSFSCVCRVCRQIPERTARQSLLLNANAFAIFGNLLLLFIATFSVLSRVSISEISVDSTQF